MKLTDLGALCSELEKTSSRLAKTEATAGFLRRLSPEEVTAAVAFLTGRPFPASDPRVLDASWALLSAVFRDAAPAPSESVLTLADVAQAFAAVADLSGPGSRKAKADQLRNLVDRATGAERETLRRILSSEMRIGLHDGLLQDAVATASGAEPALVRRASLFLSDLAEVARIALTEGAGGLARANARLFVPLLPMLAQPVEAFDEVFAAHGARTALEFKYDGARIQLHKQDNEVRIWSRRLTEVTASLPEVVVIGRKLSARTAILDGEVVAVAPDGKPLPFQDLMRRFRRVHDIAEVSAEIPIVLHFFDCLWADDRSLIDAVYEERWSVLARVTGGEHLAKRLVASSRSEAESFFAESLAAGHEGVVAKELSSPYEPGSRGKRWFKVKQADTVDCAIIAADRGSGRRRGWLSNYHLAVADGRGGFAPVGKTFKGLTDAEFTSMTERLTALAQTDDGYTVTVRPEVVVEVAFNEVQTSPQYSSGFALRFARIKRIRDDKGPGQITTLEELRSRFDSQFATKGRPRAAGDSKLL